MRRMLACATAPIGFFDSGVGGLCVRDACTRLMPYESTVYIADTANCPYGGRPSEEILAFSRGHVKRLVDLGCKLVVVACNTATAAAIDKLRIEWGDFPLVGMEPAVKPAVLRSKTGIVGVLATKGTFHGRLYRETCARFASKTKVIACVADDFVTLVEEGVTDGPRAEAAVRRHVEPLREAGADELVLGCTHFPHLKPLIEQVAAGRAEVLDPSDAVARQVRRILASRDMLAPENATPTHRFIGDSPIFQARCQP